MFRLTKQFFGHVLPGVVRPLRILWNEVIGFLFLAIAGLSTPAVFRSYRDLDKPSGSPVRLFISASFALIMVYFGVTSFLRARKIGRS
jgi:hypothetical protein